MKMGKSNMKMGKKAKQFLKDECGNKAIATAMKKGNIKKGSMLESAVKQNVKKAADETQGAVEEAAEGEDEEDTGPPPS